MKTKRNVASRKITALLSAMMISGQFASTSAVIYAYAESEAAVDYSVEQSISSSWDGGCCAGIILTNLTDEDTENWSITFSSADKITNLWNGSITEASAYVDYYQYTVVAADYNKEIFSGQSVYIGYTSEGQVHDFVDARADLVFAGGESIATDTEQNPENNPATEVEQNNETEVGQEAEINPENGEETEPTTNVENGVATESGTENENEVETIPENGTETESNTENQIEPENENKTEVEIGQEEVNTETRIYISDEYGNPVPATVKLYAGWGDLEKFFLTLTNVNDTDGSVAEYIALSGIPDGIYIARITADGYKEVLTEVNAIQTLQINNICMEKELSNKIPTSTAELADNIIDVLKYSRSINDKHFIRDWYQCYLDPDIQPCGYEGMNYYYKKITQGWAMNRHETGQPTVLQTRYAEVAYNESLYVDDYYHKLCTQSLGVNGFWLYHSYVGDGDPIPTREKFDADYRLGSYLYVGPSEIYGKAAYSVSIKSNMPVFADKTVADEYAALCDKYWESGLEIDLVRVKIFLLDNAHTSDWIDRYN